MPHIILYDDSWKNYPCKNWQGKKIHGYGYQSIKIHGKQKWQFMHRVTMEQFLNRKLNRNELVCHKCDNPSCYEIEHLFVGSARDNVIDAYQKGNTRMGFQSNQQYIRKNPLKGEQHPYAKISADIVRQIRSLHKSGKFSQREIAKKFNLNFKHVHKIVHNILWKHI